MKTINCLLGSSEPRVSNLIEVLVRDVGYNQVMVNFIRTGRITDFLRLGGSNAFELIIVDPDSLLPGLTQKGRPSIAEVARTVQTIRNQSETPVIAVSVPTDNQVALLDAGCDTVLGLPFHCDALKNEVRRLLRLAEKSPDTAHITKPKHNRWSLGTALVRGWLKPSLKQG